MYNLLKPVAVLALAAVLSVFHQGCAVTDKVARYPLDGPYMAETEACAVGAKSKADSQACRALVNWRYGLCPSEVLPC